MSPETTNSTGSSAPKRDTLFILTILVGVTAIILILILGLGMMPVSTSAISPEVCAAKIVSYTNENLVQSGSSVSLISARDYRGIYEIRVKYNSKVVTVYSTRDCGLLFTDAINLSASLTQTTTRQTLVQSDRPVVDLYVMAYCPYGTQAEEVMEPVVALLGKNADFHVRYITSVSGNDLSSVQSLHGSSEVNEDAFQICVEKTNASALWPYIHAFNTKCYATATSSAGLAECRKGLLPSLGLNNTSIEKCMAGSDAIEVLKSDETREGLLGVTGSPTLIINNVTYVGSRTPEAYKQAICNSFTTKPDECNTALSSNTTAAQGSC
ncbi:MAG: thioredoxin domain-containing protein [Methanoregulaceae archaeon]